MLATLAALTLPILLGLALVHAIGYGAGFLFVAVLALIWVVFHEQGAWKRQFARAARWRRTRRSVISWPRRRACVEARPGQPPMVRRLRPYAKTESWVAVVAVLVVVALLIEAGLWLVRGGPLR